MSAAPCSRACASAEVEPVVDSDESPAPDHDCVGGDGGIWIVVGELQPRHKQEVVLPAGAFGLGEDLGDVLGVVRGMNSASRRFGRQPRVVAADDVVGHREDVEAVLSIEVGELGKSEGAVAPTRVRMELAEQRLDFPAHPLSGCVTVAERGAISGYASAESR